VFLVDRVRAVDHPSSKAEGVADWFRQVMRYPLIWYRHSPDFLEFRNSNDIFTSPKRHDESLTRKRNRPPQRGGLLSIDLADILSGPTARKRHSSTLEGAPWRAP
jgi:hypothetical protein